MKRSESRALEILALVLGLESHKRNEVIATQCEGDSVLERHVRELLAFEEVAEALIDPSVAATLPIGLDETTTEATSRVGPYQILGPIGSGGMGSVYRARQTEPIQRTVALKVIRPGLDSKEVLARFEVEHTALAMLNHPSIAKVHDAGVTPDGRPYFVMEYVAGVPLTEYCNQHKLSLRGRLELFIQICAGVQHAHQKGIIHRDLKPSNILVSLLDGKPVAKIIDFGVAKATFQRLTERTLYTGFGQLVGTPEYMSPEQAEATPLDIDTRTDVYSLGVVLYELISGVRPFDSRTLRDAGYAEILRVIREVEPEKPSTRLAEKARTETTKPQQRTSTTSWVREVRGDLDWITMKALEKDRTRRYDTAAELAADVQRHLDYEPVLAGPPSGFYRFRKFVRRHRVPVFASTALVFMMAASLVLVSLFYKQSQVALAERGEALNDLRLVSHFQAVQLAEINVPLMGVHLREELLEKVKASGQRRKWSPDEVAERVAQLEDIIEGADFTGMALHILDEDIFVRTEEAIIRQFKDKPRVQANLLETLSMTMRDLGLLDRATEPQERALEIRRREQGDEHPDTLACVSRLGLLFRLHGKYREAQSHFEEALQAQRRTLGPDDPDTVLSLNNLASALDLQGRFQEAELYYREALTTRRRILGDDHGNTLVSLMDLAGALHEQGKYDESRLRYEEALDAQRRVNGNDHPDTLACLQSMGRLLQAQGEFANAETLLQEALEGSRRVLGDEHSVTLATIASLGSLLQSQRRWAESEGYLREALETRQRVLGKSHPRTLTSMGALGLLLQNLGQLDDAAAIHREVHEIQSQVLGEEHPSTLASLNNVAQMQWLQGEVDGAKTHFREILQVHRRKLGNQHPDTLKTINNLAVVCRSQQKPKEAEPYFREALQLSRQIHGEEHPQTIISISGFATVLRDLGKFDESEELAETAVRLSRKVHGPEHFECGYFLARHGQALQALGRYKEAVARFEEAHTITKATAGEEHERTKTFASLIKAAYKAWDESEPDAEGSQR